MRGKRVSAHGGGSSMTAGKHERCSLRYRAREQMLGPAARRRSGKVMARPAALLVRKGARTRLTLAMLRRADPYRMVLA
jgi:hypothetical protein